LATVDVPPAPAFNAIAATGYVVDSYAVTELESLHLRAQADDCARGLVARDNVGIRL